MSTLPTRLIIRMLGAESAVGGPFALLGISLVACTPQRIDAALQRQLDRVNQHPDADTPEAERLRLALHEAATALHDPARRATLADLFPDTVLDPITPNRERPGLVPSSDLMAARVTARAAASDLEDRLSAAAVPATPRAASTPTSEGFDSSSNDPHPSTISYGLLVAGGIAVLSVFSIVLAVVLSPGRVSAPSPEARTPVAITPPAPGPSSSPPPPPQAPPIPTAAPSTSDTRTPFTDGSLVLAGFRGARAKLATDRTAALAEFSTAVRIMSDWWVQYTDAERLAGVNGVVDFLFEAPSAVAPQALIAVGRGAETFAALTPTGTLDPDAVWPAVWSTGLLTRLSRERELPSALQEDVRARLLAALGPARLPGERSFEAGATVALRAIAATFAPAGAASPDAAERVSIRAVCVERWLDAARSIARNDEQALENLVVPALNDLLIAPAETDQDLGAFQTVQALGTALRWRAGGAGRSALIRWFRDPLVSPFELHTLTQAISGQSGAEGVDQTMVLSLSATSDERQRLRAQYAKVWNLAEAAGHAEALAQLRLAAGEATARAEKTLSDSAPDNESLLRALVELARTSEAARKLWRGDDAGAQALLDATPALIADVKSTDARRILLAPGIASSVSDGVWSERFFQAEQRIPARLERLTEAANLQRPIGQADAGVIIDAAYLGTPIQVRAAAQRVVRTFADEPAIVAAMLDALPRAPKIISIAELIQRVGLATLPPVTDPGWEAAARRSLVERLLSMLSTDGFSGRTEVFAREFAESYQRAAGIEPGTGIGAAAEGAIAGVRLLIEQQRADSTAPSDALSRPDTRDRKRRSRLSLASGPVQVFAAEQASLAELLAQVIASERPQDGAVLESTMRVLAQQRRAARHVFAQITAAESAIVRLWLIRFGDPGA